MGGAQVGEGLQIGLVLLYQLRICQEIHRYHRVSAFGGAAYAGGCYVMGVVTEAFQRKYVVTGLDHACVVGVYVPHVYPGAGAVRFKFQPHRADYIQILVEQKPRLGVGIEALRLVLGKAEAVEQPRRLI